MLRLLAQLYNKPQLSMIILERRPWDTMFISTYLSTSTKSSHDRTKNHDTIATHLPSLLFVPTRMVDDQGTTDGAKNNDR